MCVIVNMFCKCDSACECVRVYVYLGVPKFLSHVLKVFGFGDTFCSWIKIMYNDISSCVMNGTSS